LEITWTNYSFDDFVDKIYPHQIADESRIAMLSEYNITHDFDVTDLADSFRMFDPGTWTSIFITLSMYAILLKFFLTVRQRTRMWRVNKRKKQI
jgi:hypothetical protein